MKQKDDTPNDVRDPAQDASTPCPVAMMAATACALIRKAHA